MVFSLECETVYGQLLLFYLLYFITSFMYYVQSSHKILLLRHIALSVFLLGYHVHEKAILSTIIRLTLLPLVSRDHARLYICLRAFGHFGLLPSLFHIVESLFKIYAWSYI
jgi:hypothetical protein